MSGVNSLLPEGFSIQNVLQVLSFQSAFSVDISASNRCPCQISNLLMQGTRTRLSGLTLIDSKVLPSLISLGETLYCLSEGEWENRASYGDRYSQRVLIDSYQALEVSAEFQSLVLKLTKAIRAPQACQECLDACLARLLQDCEDISQIGDRVRPLTTFILALLVASNIPCESLGMLTMMDLFCRVERSRRP